MPAGNTGVMDTSILKLWGMMKAGPAAGSEPARVSARLVGVSVPKVEGWAWQDAGCVQGHLAPSSPTPGTEGVSGTARRRHIT